MFPLEPDRPLLNFDMFLTNPQLDKREKRNPEMSNVLDHNSTIQWLSVCSTPLDGVDCDNDALQGADPRTPHTTYTEYNDPH